MKKGMRQPFSYPGFLQQHSPPPYLLLLLWDALLCACLPASSRQAEPCMHGHAHTAAHVGSFVAFVPARETATTQGMTLSVPVPAMPPTFCVTYLLMQHVARHGRNSSWHYNKTRQWEGRKRHFTCAFLPCLPTMPQDQRASSPAHADRHRSLLFVSACLPVSCICLAAAEKTCHCKGTALLAAAPLCSANQHPCLKHSFLPIASSTSK